MSIKVIIVDDESLALNLLSAILSDIDDIELVAQCQNGKEAVEAVLEHSPDIMFLDIQMPEMNGFDVIAAIQSDILPLVIFTTAYADYAVNAFKVQAIDYVLKPLDEANIAESIARARIVLNTGKQSRKKPELLSALHDVSKKVNIDMSSNEPKTLIVKESDRLAFLARDHIDWVEAAGDYVCIHSKGETRIMRATLKMIEAQLSDPQFQRIHRSTIVNMNKVLEVISGQKGEALIVMSDQSRLRVSRSYGAILRARFA